MNNDKSRGVVARSGRDGEGDPRPGAGERLGGRSPIINEQAHDAHCRCRARHCVVDRPALVMCPACQTPMWRNTKAAKVAPAEVKVVEPQRPSRRRLALKAAYLGGVER